jgi:hypothetical protein
MWKIILMIAGVALAPTWGMENNDQYWDETQSVLNFGTMEKFLSNSKMKFHEKLDISKIDTSS